jgi:hypothetical protein
MLKGYAIRFHKLLILIQHLEEFSRALASEVQELLGEVGRIREEKRRLQQYVCLFHIFLFTGFLFFSFFF